MLTINITSKIREYKEAKHITSRTIDAFLLYTFSNEELEELNNNINDMDIQELVDIVVANLTPYSFKVFKEQFATSHIQRIFNHFGRLRYHEFLTDYGYDASIIDTNDKSTDAKYYKIIDNKLVEEQMPKVFYDKAMEYGRDLSDIHVQDYMKSNIVSRHANEEEIALSSPITLFNKWRRLETNVVRDQPEVLTIINHIFSEEHEIYHKFKVTDNYSPEEL